MRCDWERAEIHGSPTSGHLFRADGTSWEVSGVIVFAFGGSLMSELRVIGLMDGQAG